MSQQFDELFLDTRLLRAIGGLGWSAPTDIQSEVIPLLLDGLDLIGSAPTGTGKTAAFVLPLLQQLLETHANRVWPKALILEPTRELANQVRRSVEQLSEYTRISSTVLTGGVPEERQQLWLKDQPEIIVATPGRLRYHLDNSGLSLLDVEMLVLDEADRMLDMGFVGEVAGLIGEMPARRQTVLLSATLEDDAVMDFAREITDQPQVIEVGGARTVPAGIAQRAYLADSAEHKYALLSAMLDDYKAGPRLKADDPEPGRVLVFTNTRLRAEELASKLHSEGIAVAALHGDLDQRQRNQQLRNFRGGRLGVLVATDVAARGLHIDAVDMVINYDMPRGAETYVHRAGRSGRLGADGQVLSLVEAHDARSLQRIERFTHQPIERAKWAGLEPKHKEPEFKRKKKKRKENALKTKKPRPKQRLRDQKNKGKPKWARKGKRD